jgi:hypothetical protein
MLNFIRVLLKDSGDDVETISFKTLRKWVGYLGVALPFVLVGGSMIIAKCPDIQHSISHYYYSNMKVFFVGILCAVSFFLISYSGYSRLDNILTNVAAVFCLLVAVFPTDLEQESDWLKNTNTFIDADLHVLHFVSAGLFFLILAIISIWLFTRSNKAKEHLRPEKKRRNTIYRYCGWIMIFSLLAIGGRAIFFGNDTHNPTFVFWFETLMLVAFGVSWLTKAEVISGDK